MRNKIVKTIIGTTALCMAILTIAFQPGINATQTFAKADFAAEQNSATYGTEFQYITMAEKSNTAYYEPSDSMTYGVADAKATFYTRIDFEGYYGFTLNTTGGKITVTPYKHTKSVSKDDVELTLYMMDSYKLENGKSIGKAPLGETTELGIALKEGYVYAIGGKFACDGIDEKQECLGYLVLHDGKPQACRYSDRYSDDGWMKEWHTLMDGENPEDYLSNEKITYPTSGSGNCVVHVKQWEDISDEIVGKHIDDWSDECKLFAFVDYLSKNVAYDDYRARQKNNRSRANLAGDYTKDEYFTLGNNVGVCWDYTNILAIMCRYHGIPCTSVENERHTINAVWIGGRWIPVDLTDTAKWNCATEDTSRENWKKNGSATYCYYGKYNTGSHFDTVNESIWTREKGLGIK